MTVPIARFLFQQVATPEAFGPLHLVPLMGCGGAALDRVERPAFFAAFENLLLVGESGMGKTMLIRKFERQTIAAFDDAGGVQRRPVVVMLMPHQPTEAQFFGQLLSVLHTPVAGISSVVFRCRDPAVRLLHELDTRVVVIDELNSLLAGTPRQQRVFLQLLRFLSNELGCQSALNSFQVWKVLHAVLHLGPEKWPKTANQGQSCIAIKGTFYR